MRQYLTKKASQTKNLGGNLALKIIKIRGKKRAVVIGLIGDLGGGKTTFLQGFARGLGIKQTILSPTFIIMKKFEIRNSKLETPNSRAKLTTGQANSKFPNSKFKTFIHIDCYRIEKSKEILDLGFKKIISDPKNIIAIEWADKVRKIVPKDAMWIKFEFIDKNSRKIILRHTV